MNRERISVASNAPEPGEVWIVVERSTGPETWQFIHEERPFIVTYVSTAFIGYVCAGRGPEGETGTFARTGPHSFSWHEHCVRIWPSLPSWDELRVEPLAQDDLRAQVHKGE